MTRLLRAEFRKLFTVRSTYLLTSVALLLAGFLSFWAMGYKGSPENDAIAMETVMNVGTTLPIFIAIIAILLMTHEYRFNMITYTFTASNSRNKVLLAKIVAVVVFALGFTALAAAASVGLAWLGTMLRDTPIAPQHFHYMDTLWRTTVYTLGFVGMGLLFAVWFRHVVGAIVALLLIPTVEGILSLLIKENAKYLPFQVLEQIHTQAVMSASKAALIFGGYLLAGWIIGWIMFLRRDAS